MKRISVFILFFVLSVIGGVLSSTTGDHFYRDLGCTEITDGKIKHYQCSEFNPKNGSCSYKGKILNFSERVDAEHLKGSCHADCHCGVDGRIVCAQYDCFERLKSGCSHFRYSLDSCCPVDSVCGPIASCEIEGTTYQEGNTVYLKDKCEVCLCDVGFELKAPFCRPRTCYDQATYPDIVANHGAPAFFKNENCCPNIWVTDEGQEIVKINTEAAPETGLSCKFGNRTVDVGYGFKTKEQPYGTEVQLTCECNIPPLVICRENA